MAQAWTKVVQPHQDVTRGEITEALFAADLADVKARRAAIEYQDPVAFFSKTYPTEGLRRLLATVLARLAGVREGDPVIQLQTPFGGGKTHSLLALYHLCTAGGEIAHLDAVQKVMEEAGVEEIPQVRVATFVGTAADAERGKTPWGEIAEQLGNYDLLAEHDRKRRAPGKELLHELLGGQPTLILMDEIVEYAVKAEDFRDQLMAFLQEITEAVKVQPSCALVVTLPSSASAEAYANQAITQMLMQAEKILGRIEAIYTPVHGEEMYEVVRRRLFEDLGDPAEARRAADEYWQMYQRLGEDVPGQFRDPAYRDKMRRAYPFHPEVIDIMFERWSTFPSFQRTRGVLRLLANVVADLYGRGHDAPLIQPAHINLAKPDIQREFIRHIGNEYSGVVASDIADSNAKAQQIDREMGSEYARYGVASGIATAIFFYSFSAGPDKGVAAQRLRVAFLRDGIPPAVVGDALQRLEDELWYLHVEGGLYRFTSQPNLNRVIVEREEAVEDEDIVSEIRKRLEAAEKRGQVPVQVYCFPQAPHDVPDSRDLKLAILSGEYTRGNLATDKFVEELLTHAGTTFRSYRNTLLVVAPDADEFAGLRQQVKRYLALDAIRSDKEFMNNLRDEAREELIKRWQGAKEGVEFRLLAAYRHVARAGAERPVEWIDMGIPTMGEAAAVSQRVLRYLRQEDLLLDKIAARQVLNKTLQKHETEKSLRQIWEAFLQYPELPILANQNVLRQAVEQGVREGVFGLRVGDRVYFKEPLPSAALGADWLDAVLVRPEAVQKPEAVDVAESRGDEGRVVDVIEVEDEGEAEGDREAEEAVREWHLKARIPWDKMSDFIRGVILPLHNAGAELEIEISIKATSNEGIPSDILHDPIGVTLRQSGIILIQPGELHE